MFPDIRDITTDCSPVPIHTLTEAATSEGIPCTLLSTITTAHATLKLIDTPAMITTGIVALNHIISSAGATHTTPWTEAALTPAADATQHRIIKQCPRCPPSKTPLPQNSHHAGFSFSLLNSF